MHGVAGVDTTEGDIVSGDGKGSLSSSAQLKAGSSRTLLYHVSTYQTHNPLMDGSSLEKIYRANQDVDSTDTELRYMAYGARLRTALRASHRYVAYVRPLICY